MTRVLVTGGAGFIGRELVARLCDRGDEVVVLDREAAGVDARAELVHGDLADPAVCAAAVRGVDVVSHQAARVGLGKDPSDLPLYAADNDLGTARLLSALWASGFSGRLVLASSMVVYGEGRYRCPQHGETRPAGRRPDDLDAGRFEVPCPACASPMAWERVPESAPFDPRSGYAATKAAQEHLTSAWAREVGASVVALRYHNVYGPGLPRDTPSAGVAALFLSSLLRGEAPTVFEDGGQTRDFVHVADVAAANLLALGAPDAAPPGQLVPLNVCSGRAVTILEVAETLSRVVQGPAPVVTGRWRPGDVRHVVADPAAATDVLGFQAAVGLDEGLAELAGVPSASGS
ncbi:MAG: NAD-dependent epimerase/dehydratase family protein [Acidimicrobiia bacterium]